MPRHADPTRCPDCSAALPVEPGTCPTCGLPLTGPLADELLSTLHRADLLVAELRASVPAVRVGVDAVAVMGGDDGAVALAPPRSGMGALSVPKVLLGLGATCLLVAAVIFLAVAWSWLGIGGRTAVLVAATLATGALGLRLGRRDLRVGAEALVAVSLGLLVLDLAGAQDAGWFGGLAGSGFVVLVGSVVAVAGAGLLLPGALGAGRRPLVVPQLAVVVGALAAMVSVHDLTDLTTLVLVVELLLCAAVVRATLGRDVPFVVGGLASVGALGWAYLVALGLVESGAAHSIATLRGLWLEGDGLALLAAVLLALLPIAVIPARPWAWQVGVAVSGSTATVLLVLPGLDDGSTRAASVWLAALVIWVGVAAIVGRPGGPAVLARTASGVRVPLGLTALVSAALLGQLAARAADNVLGVAEVFDVGAAVRLDAAPPQVSPLLVAPLAVALLAAAYVGLPWRRLVVEGTAAALVLAALVTLAQYAVPLWTVVGLLVALGLVALTLALRESGDRARVAAGVGAVLLALGAVAALPSAVLTAAVLTTATAAAVALLALRVPTIERTAGAVAPLALAGTVWSTAVALDTSVAWCGLVVLAGGGLLAIVLPRIEVELAAVVAALLVAPASVAAAGDESVALAVHLTLAGALVTASALVHRDRRLLAAPGGLLLAAATWVRLADLGVSAPEAYTLPTALVLLALGVHRLRSDPAAPTATALLPGLVLATVPSLLWVLGDPVSLRALLLGAACLGLVVLGAQARWSAPLVVGALVGLALVLRELAPYVAQTPQWVAIGLAGTVLTVVGVTWEKRLQDVQRAGALLGRLR